MSKAKVLKIVNPFLGFFLIIQIISGFTQSSIAAMHIIHEYCVFALTIFFMLHIYLNFNWIKKNFLNISDRK